VLRGSKIGRCDKLSVTSTEVSSELSVDPLSLLLLSLPLLLPIDLDAPYDDSEDNVDDTELPELAIELPTEEAYDIGSVDVLG